MNRFFVMVWCVLLAVCSGLGFDLVKDGRAAATIVVDPKAPDSVSYAAEQLALYVEKMTGVKLRIAPAARQGNVIRLGVLRPAPDVRPEEIRIRCKSPYELIVSGEGPRGPLYAVYQLLEELGVGFWGPSNESWPSVKTLTLPSTYSHRSAPAFESRFVWGEAHRTPWRAKHRMNGGKDLSPRQGGYVDYDVNHSIPGRFVSTDLLKQHPEWQALRKSHPGSERDDKGTRTLASICPSNEGLVAEVIKEVRAYLEKNPEARMVSVSPSDTDQLCQCTACWKANGAGQKDGRVHGYAPAWLGMVNKVAKHLAKDFPNVRVCFLAYWWTYEPPTKASFKLEPNVTIAVACLGRNFFKPPEGEYVRFLTRWSELSHRNLYIWGYSCCFSMFPLPWPSLHPIADEMRLYRKLGVKGISAQHPWGGLGDFADLRAYLYSKLTWNPDEDAQRLIETWCRGACGKGADDVLAYINLVKKAGDKWNRGCGVYVNFAPWMKPEDYREGDRLLRRALEATRGDKRTHDAVRRIYGGLLCASLIADGYWDEWKEFKPPAGMASYEERLAEYKKLDKEFPGCFCEWVGMEVLIQYFEAQAKAGPGKRKAPR